MKYKAGDEVLVRMKVTDVLDYTKEKNVPCLRVKSSFIDTCHVLLSDIYSLAPEFSPGELIEVSNDGVNWRESLFAGIAYTEQCGGYPFLALYESGGAVLFWNFARKIQPKEEVSWSMNIEENFASAAGHPIVPTHVEINGTKYKLQKVEG